MHMGWRGTCIEVFILVPLHLGVKSFDFLDQYGCRILFVCYVVVYVLFDEWLYYGRVYKALLCAGLASGL